MDWTVDIEDYDEATGVYTLSLYYEGEYVGEATCSGGGLPIELGELIVDMDDDDVLEEVADLVWDAIDEAEADESAWEEDDGEDDGEDDDTEWDEDEAFERA